MPKFVFAYHGGGMPETPEEGARMMAAWNDWYAAMGDAVVDGGAPVGQSMTVSQGGVTGDGGANPLSGYTVVQADTIDAACEMANGCPMIADGSGTVEVAPVIEM
ncbi:YciI family protein [Tateyamaria sp. Alg231-49]|uniref:YciI family protein n=1 Tax=Tateyamaria sp. Alg231-49 TaxID=1922219 RepID=UPI000D559323|nr:YciI family protein [Tateyamaria sp. Alg231-49]